MFTKKTYNDIYEDARFNIGKIRLTVCFTNKRQCDLTILGELYPMRFLKNSSGEEEAAEYEIIKARKKLEHFLESLETECKYIIADNGVIYNLDHNEIDCLEIREDGDLVINKKVFKGREVKYE